MSEFFKYGNNGKEINFEQFKRKLSDSDVKNNTTLQKLFKIFDTDGSGSLEETNSQGDKELDSIFSKIKQSTNSDGNDELSGNELEMFINSVSPDLKEEEKKDIAQGLKSMFTSIISIVAQTQNTSVTVDNLPTNVNLTEEQAQDEVISIILKDAAEARTLLMKQHNGVVSDLYNKYKEWRDDDLSLSNVEEAVVLQQEGADNLYKAKERTLSKREYFLQNREHLKTMMKRRLFRKDENTGLDFIDRNRGNMSKDEFAKLMEDYINKQIDQIDKLDSLQQLKHTLLVTTEVGTEQMLKNFQKKAEEKPIHDPINERNFNKIKKPLVPIEYDTTEPMTFEEVFKYERNTEYSKEKVENYLRQKQKTDFAIGAYNKYQSFKMASDEFLDNYKSSTKVYSDMDGNSWGGKEPNPSEQMNKVIELFTAYYDNPFKPDLAKEELEHLISENNLPISVITKEDGSISLVLSRINSNNQKNRVLNQLVNLESSKLKEQLETTLGDNIEEKMQALSQDTQSAYNSAYGYEFSNELVQLMADDNKTFIQKYTGNTSMVGMGLTVIGGILCFTPAAPLGAGMVTVGNTLAIGGMVAESGLGYTEALTRSSLDEEEIIELSKTLIMNTGGFVIGMQAGKTGMKAFNKLIDKKLAEVFKTEMVKGNRAEALKQVFANPEHLKNFMQAAGVKLSADFVISYAGDLAMMGVLDTQDDWQSLLQSNLIGIMTGMSGDIKDVASYSMKGDKYRALKQKEREGKISPKEASELASLRKDPDIKHAYPEDEMTNQTTEGVNEGVKPKTSTTDTPTRVNYAGIDTGKFNNVVSELRGQIQDLPSTQAKLNKVFSYLQNPKNMSQLFNSDCIWAEGCERNSQAFALICKELGLEGVETKTGTYTDAFGSAEEHMWTEVTIDGKTLIYDLAQKQALPKDWSPNPTKQAGYKEGEVTSPKSVKDKTSVENQADGKPEAKPIRELSDAEFKAMKPEIEAKLKEKDIYFEDLNKYSIQLADKILSDKNLSRAESMLTCILWNVQTAEQAQLRYNLINKIFSDEKLCGNNNYIYWVSDILLNISTPEQIKLVDKILSDEKLYGNENFMDKAQNFISYIETEEQIKLADKILSDEKFYGNENFMNKALEVICMAKNKETAKLVDKILFNDEILSSNNISILLGNAKSAEQIKIIDKILSDKRLYGSKNVIENVSKILWYISNTERAMMTNKLIDKILSDERLYGNENFMNKSSNIIGSISTQEHAKIKGDMIDKILSDERLCNNKNFMNHASGIIDDIFTQEQAKIKWDIIDTILSDEKLYNNEKVINNIGDIVESTSEYNIIFVKRLCTDKELDFPKEYIADIVSSTDYPNITLAEKLCTDKELDFPRDKIAETLNYFRYLYNEIPAEQYATKIKQLLNMGFKIEEIADILGSSRSLEVFDEEICNVLKRKQEQGLDIAPLAKSITSDSIPAKLPEQVNLLQALLSFEQNDCEIFKKHGIDIKYKINILQKAIDKKHPIIDTTNEQAKSLLKALANNGNADEVIQNLDFTTFGEDGIRLQYSREEFMQKMTELIAKYQSNSSELILDNVKIPKLELTEEQVAKTQEKINKLKEKYPIEETTYIVNGKECKVERFKGSKTNGSNEGDFALIDGKLYYVKYPKAENLGQSTEEVIASQLYRTAGIDAPNETYLLDKKGKVKGMASEYIPEMSDVSDKKMLFDSFATDAWLANWDAPKNDNTQIYGNGKIIKSDVGGALHYRAQGEYKLDFGNVVNELISLIEHNPIYANMTKADLVKSLEHVVNVPNEAIYKIITDSPLNDVNLAATLIKRKEFMEIFKEKVESLDESSFSNITDLITEAKRLTIIEFNNTPDIAGLLGYIPTRDGFEGLLNTQDLSKEGLTPEQKTIAEEMRKEIRRFTVENRLADDINVPEETRSFVNQILQGIPEFASYFGKPQHSGHDNSLDIHILKVLQSSLNDPIYNKVDENGKRLLDDESRIVLKFSALLHDIGKRYLAGGSDIGHAALSAEYVYSLLDRFNLPTRTKNRIINMVNHHHWFADYGTNRTSAQTVATIFRTTEDFTIARILAKADLENVRDGYFENIMMRDYPSEVHDKVEAYQKFENEMDKIQSKINDIEKNQPIVTPSKFVEVPERVTPDGRVIARRGFPVVQKMLDGKMETFKVLNLHDLDPETDMYQYGFNHIKLKDLRFLVHRAGDGQRANYDTFRVLGANPQNESLQSITLIKATEPGQYVDNTWSFVLEGNNNNLGMAYNYNAGTGRQKTLVHMKDEFFGDGIKNWSENDTRRVFFKQQFISYFQNKGIEIDDATYSAIVKYVRNKPYPETQIKSIKIGEQVFTKEDLLEGFFSARDALINSDPNVHNEETLLDCIPVAGGIPATSMEDVPLDFLRVCRDNCDGKIILW